MGLSAPAVATCMPVLANYKDFFGKNYPQGTDKGDTSTLQMLKSRDNTAGLKQLSDFVTGVPGKKRGVRMQYREPVCAEVCSTQFTCKESRYEVSTGLKVIDYNIESRWHPCKTEGGITKPLEIVLKNTEFAQYCMTDNVEEFKEMQMESDLNFLQQMDLKVLQTIHSKVLPANTKVKSFFAASTSGQNVLRDEWLIEVMATLQADGKKLDDYFMLGGMFLQYLKLKYTGFMTSSTQGGTFAGVNLPSTYFDVNFDAIFGNANSFLLVPKGAFQLVQWIENEVPFRDERYMSGTRLVPIGNGYNMRVDFEWKYDPECKDYKYMPYSYMEVPLAYSQNCANNKENNIYLFQNCNSVGLPDCQPIP